MADTTAASDSHGPTFQSYMIVAGALAICTIASFFFNTLADQKSITHFQSFLAILTVAIIKASLVAWIFMHLKWDWKLLYFLLIPAFILGVMMMIVLMPDSLLGPLHDAEDGLKIAEMLQKGKP